MTFKSIVSGLRVAAIATVLPLAAIVSAPSNASAFSFTSIYALGDSLSDTGNSYAATNGLLPPNSLYPSNGRFSNGPVWVEYLASDLGSPLQNLAFGGARTDTTNTFPGLPGLAQQVGSITAADPSALYILWAGANDYLNGGKTNPVSTVTNLDNAVLALAAKGAKNIAVGNLPNLGALPGTRPDPLAPNLSLLTQAHNALLAQTLGVIQQTQPGLTLYSLDFYSLFADAIANPANYGFTNVTDSCLLTGCSTPKTYLFWDAIHPTTAGHAELADFAFASLQSQAVPEPSETLGLLLAGAGLIGLGVLRKRRQQSTLSAPLPQPLNQELAVSSRQA